MSKFGHGSTALEVVEGVDLRGKIALITGASSGIGVETARALASAGARIVMPVRDPAKGEAVKQDIIGTAGNQTVDVMRMDLADFESVRDFAQAFLAGYSTLDILINNAGIMAGPLVRTSEGYESQFATNHLGHFLLTGLLAPALVNSAAPRVVALSSLAHRISDIIFDDIHFETRAYDKWQAYGQAKTANALFALELNKRLQKHGGLAFSVHPGGIMTNLQKDLTKEEIEGFGWVDKDGNIREGFKSVEGGASTAVWAATTQDLGGQGGAYLEDCSVAGLSPDRTVMAGKSAHIDNEDTAAILWDISEEMVGERFPF